MKWNFFKVFFPSWKFFAEAGGHYQLYFRMISLDGTGEWQMLVLKSPRHLGHLFLSAAGNRDLALNGLIERLLMDASESEEPDELTLQVSYQLVQNLVEVDLIADQKKVNGTSSQRCSYQFKVKMNEDDIFLSAEHETGAL